MEVLTDIGAKSVALHTLGCKLNYAEGAGLLRQFAEAGYTVVDFEAEADVYIINTCSVTEHADKKTRGFVRRALSFNPNAQVVIIGCYAQLKPKEILTIPGVSLVLGAADKSRLLEHVENLHTGCEPQIFNSPIKDVKEFFTVAGLGDRTRSFLKVQDGCDYFCSFCTIPLARGRSRGGSIDNIIAEARRLEETGIKEIVLTGVNIGDFKNESGQDFFDLIQELDKEIKNVSRFRISSIEPNLLSDKIIDFVGQNERFVPHFHIPMQTGSPRLLEKMRRRYTPELYAARIHRIKELMPDACIGADVIVGFPGETDYEFETTRHFITSLPLSYLHVFTYSERPNTTAIRMQGVVPVKLRQERNALLTQISERLKTIFYTNQAGSQRSVLWEQEEKNGFMHGYTENYLRVRKAYDEAAVNTVEKVLLAEYNPEEGVFLTDSR